MFSMWAYLAVAAVIAATAFGIGYFSGLGVAFVVLASTLWTGYSVKRQTSSKPSC